MIRNIMAVTLCCMLMQASAQVTFTVTRNQKAPLISVFDPATVKDIPSSLMKLPDELPEPEGTDDAVKAAIDAQRTTHPYLKDPNPMRFTKRSAVMPSVVKGFDGALNEGTPNDNNLAVSNGGYVISVLNTFIRVYDDTGKFLKNWSLESFPKDAKNTRPGTGVGTLDRSYDPKAVYDPVSDRFIIVYLEGSASNDTRVIIAFSKTNNPLDGWYVYQLNGNPYGGAFWTDYPIIGLSNEDLFITGNILKDNTDWRDGFTQSVIWQVPKSYGYNGDTLRYDLFGNIKYNGKSVWNICAIPDGMQQGYPGMHFLSVRPGDKSNDTVFLHNINQNYSTRTAQYSLRVLKTDKPYGLPPTALQKQAGFKLQTNDARVLSGFFHRGTIQYVQTTNNPANLHSSVYHGIISDVDGTPVVKGAIISRDTLDFAYPSIVYAGDAGYNQNAIITFSHSSDQTFPGTSAVYLNDRGEYSDVIRVKAGKGIINSFIADTAERWGDYTGIQRQYNKPGVIWMAGSYGTAANKVGTWVAKLQIDDRSVDISTPQQGLPELTLYPNPVKEMLQVEIENVTAGNYSFDVYNIQGVKVEHVFTMPMQQGAYKFTLNTSAYAHGLYNLLVTGADGKSVYTGRFFVD